MSSRVVPVVASMIAWVAAGSVAQAQAVPSERSRARELTERAISEARKGEYAAAIALYQRAYDLSQEAVLLSNIGSAYQSLGDLDQSLTFFCRYLATDPDGKVAGFAREQATALGRELRRPSPCGKPRPKDATAGHPALAASARPSPATADVSDDGPDLSVSATPPARAASSLPRTLRVTGYLVGAGGLGALAAAGYYGWVGKRASDAITGNRDGWTADELEQEEIGEQANARMKGLLIAGGVATVSGVALVLWGRSRRGDERGLALSPALTATSQALVVSGTFD
ncbi:MAG TPA: tetratricopeptide repeat protein [Kofleriaceae bacterium]|nr:tetratricopeptide repeat protein [Kofleriaceae bacterium]